MSSPASGALPVGSTFTWPTESVSHRALMFALLSLALSSCSFDRAEKTARAACDRFHSLYNQTQYQAIYAQVDASVKAATPLEVFSESLVGHRGRLGDYKAGHALRVERNFGFGGVRIAVFWESEFARGKATEVFVWKVTGEVPTLLQYTTSPLPTLPRPRESQPSTDGAPG